MTVEAKHPGMQALNEALNASFRAFRWLIFAMVAMYVASGIFIVRQHEKALVLNFGRISGIGEDRVKEPGIHWTWPRPFCEIIKVPTERVQTLQTSSFWHRQQSEYQEEDVIPGGATLDPERDGYALTGDANILHARWAIRYTVTDPEAYVFNLESAQPSIVHELDRAVVHVTATFPADRALRTDLATLREQVEKNLAHRCADLNLGIRVQGVDLIASIPPLQVAAAFDAVVQTEQSREQTISEARAYAARTRNSAQGEAAQRRTEGETYKRRLLAEISADADTFTQVSASYARNPALFKQTILQDTLRRTLSRVEQKYVVRSSATGDQELRLQLGPEQARPRIGELE